MHLFESIENRRWPAGHDQDAKAVANKTRLAKANDFRQDSLPTEDDRMSRSFRRQLRFD